MAADNVDLQRRIFGDQTFRTEFANNLRDVGFNENNHDIERIWIVVFRAINKSVSTAENMNLQIDAGNMNLQIDAENMNLQIDAGNMNLQIDAGNMNLHIDAENMNLHIDAGNMNLQIDYDIVQSLQNLRIKSERIFEYENIRAELANIGLDVGNRNLRETWRELVGAVNNSVSAIENEDLRNDIAAVLRKLREARRTIAENDNFRNEIANSLEAGVGENNNLEQICLWKVLSLDVHSSVGACINLADENIEYTKLRLKQLLLAKRAPTRNIGNSLDAVLYRPLTQELASQLTSPKHIANKNFLGIKKDAHPDFVTNLIEKQFLIKWNPNARGEPEEFNFYEFCDVEELKENEEQNPPDVPMEVKTKHLQYDPRRAHVKVQLYRFCRTRPRIEYKKNELCPPVYIKTANGWKKWVPRENNNFQRGNPPIVDPGDTEFDWMNGLIRNYITLSAIEIEKNQLQKTYTLYWAVVEDTDFESGAHLQLNNIGKTQVYVGISKNGINGRWLVDGDNHCTKMKQCLDNVQEMITYDPLRLEDIHLVDARLLLAKLRGENCALFVMKTYERTQAGKEQMETDEKAHINGDFPGNEPILAVCEDWKPRSMAYGMNAQ